MDDSIVNTIQVSAPGKLMLLGEHGVIHGRPCLVTAMDARLRMTITLLDSGDETFILSAPDVGVDHVQGRLADAFAGGQALARGTRFIECALAVFREHFGLAHGVQIETKSDFSSQYGLGSSSATVACILFGLSRLFKVELTSLKLFELGLDVISRVQQLGSGFDLAAAIYGGTLYYQNGQPREIVPLNVPTLPLMAAYTGVKADTPTYVRRVNAREEAWPAAVKRIFDAMERLVLMGRVKLENSEWDRLGELMDMQHGLLNALGVDTPLTSSLVFAAREAGAFGAKLSGAGGGDCVIALVPEDRREAVRSAWQTAGGEVLNVAPTAPGVRVEMEAG